MHPTIGELRSSIAQVVAAITGVLSAMTDGTSIPGPTAYGLDPRDPDDRAEYIDRLAAQSLGDLGPKGRAFVDDLTVVIHAANAAAEGFRAMLAEAQAEADARSAGILDLDRDDPDDDDLDAFLRSLDGLDDPDA